MEELVNIEPCDIDDLVECGSVLILRKFGTVYFSCSFCDLKIQNLNEFIKHSFEIHFNGKQDVYDTKNNNEFSNVTNDEDADSTASYLSTQEDEDIESCTEELANTERFEMVVIGSDKHLANEKGTKQKKPKKLKDESKLQKSVISLNLDCETCGKTFQNISQLKQHVKQHSKKTHICEFCDARFTDSSNFKVHRYRHLGIKPHPCTMCDKRFISTSELKTHVRSHTGERPFKCTECGNCFRHSGLLTKHRRRHTNDRRFVCASCGKRFYEMGLLREHENSHSSDRLFACTVCDQKFARRNVLYQHSKLHSDIKQYTCDLCSKTFAQYAGLHSHKKNNHSSLQLKTKNKKD